MTRSANADPSTWRKMCPKVILEGTRLTFKTEIAFALNEHPGFVGPRKYRYHSPIVSAEWCGFTNTPWGRGCINFKPDEEDKAIETYRTWVRLFELQRYYSWIVDRFHISTIVYQQRAHHRFYDFGWLEQRLAAIGFRLILCTRSTESFESARARRRRVSGNPAQYDRLEESIAEQQAMRVAVAQSRLETLEVDVSDNDVDAATESIVGWITRTGGLWAPEPPPDADRRIPPA
jgi:hypothetical protein